MCERRDSIEKMSAAADRLGEACEAEIHALPPSGKVDPAQPTRSGVAKALRTALRTLAATPTDMALQLGRIK